MVNSPARDRDMTSTIHRRLRSQHFVDASAWYFNDFDVEDLGESYA
jgi:hypothetical protein